MYAIPIHKHSFLTHSVVIREVYFTEISYMNQCTWIELVDMHVTYGPEGGRCLQDRQLYAARFRNHRLSQHHMFSRIHQ